MEKAEYELIKKVQEDHWWFNSTRNLVSTFSADVFERSNKEVLKFLDLGSGPGSFTSLLNQYGQVTCYDIDFGSLESIDPSSQTLRVQGNGVSLGFEDATFDAVFILSNRHLLQYRLQYLQTLQKLSSRNKERTIYQVFCLLLVARFLLFHVGRAGYTSVFPMLILLCAIVLKLRNFAFLGF